MSERIAIVGSRHYPRLELVRAFVAALPAGTVVVSGGAPGVDEAAETAARAHGLEVMIFPADWNRYGRKAGPIRNAEIVAHADRVTAFWDGSSRGTLNTVVQAHRARKVVTVLGPDGEPMPLDVALRAAERMGVTAGMTQAPPLARLS